MRDIISEGNIILEHLDGAQSAARNIAISVLKSEMTANTDLVMRTNEAFVDFILQIEKLYMNLYGLLEVMPVELAEKTRVIEADRISLKEQ